MNMIKFISADEVLHLRNAVLRGNRLTPDECRFATDNLPGSFHLGYFINQKLAGVASFHIQTYGSYIGTGYQLRGMAALPEHQMKGLGTQLMNYALDYLKRQQADYIWCNARKTAIGFYRKFKFEIVSDEFESPGIGPHYAMYLNLKQSGAD